MENYILQILESSTRVIVPEFGAFIVKQRNPLTVVFNEFLQYNDGVMVDVIAKNEDISREDAKKKIDDFVKVINDTLNQGDNFPIGKLGVIVKGGLGKISLEKEEDVKKPSKKVAEKTVEVEQPKKRATTAKKKTEPKEAVAPEVKSAAKKEVETIRKGIPPENKDIPIEKEKTEKPVEKVVSEKKPPVTETVIPQTAVEEKKQPIAKEEKIHNAESKPRPVPFREIPKPEIKTGRKYKKSSIVAWVVIIVIINALLVGYFIYSDELKGIFSGRNQDTLTATPIILEDIPAEEIIAEEPANVEELPVVSEEVAEPEIVSEKKITPAGIRYYIVAGVFRDEDNADKLAGDLKRKGYNAEKFGKIGNLHAVSYDVFATKQEADRYLLKIQKEIDPEAWIRTVN